MWQWVLSVIIPMAIHLGVEAVLAAFPNLPPWLVAILKQLEGAKAEAANLPKAQRGAALAVARAKAAAQVHAACHGADCKF